MISPIRNHYYTTIGPTRLHRREVIKIKEIKYIENINNIHYSSLEVRGAFHSSFPQTTLPSHSQQNNAGDTITLLDLSMAIWCSEEPREEEEKENSRVREKNWRGEAEEEHSLRTKPLKWPRTRHIRCRDGRNGRRSRLGKKPSAPDFGHLTGQSTTIT